MFAPLSVGKASAPQKHTHTMSMFRVSTAQGVSFKLTMEAIGHCHITETNFKFNKHGITATQIDPAHNMVLHLLLERPSFQIFEMHEEEIIAGVSITTLTRLLKNVTNKDTITLSIDYNEPSLLNVVIYNDFNKTKMTHKLKILLLDEEDIKIPEREIDRVVSMPSSEFSKYIKEFAHTAKRVQFHVKNDEFKIRAHDDMCTSEAVIYPKMNVKGEVHGSGSISIGLGRNGNSEVCQSFNTKYLQSITKGNSLDDQILLYLTRQQPLLVRYNISIIGSLVYILAPDEPDQPTEDNTPQK